MIFWYCLIKIYTCLQIKIFRIEIKLINFMLLLLLNIIKEAGLSAEKSMNQNSISKVLLTKKTFFKSAENFCIPNDTKTVLKLLSKF